MPDLLVSISTIINWVPSGGLLTIAYRAVVELAMALLENTGVL